MDNMVEVEIKTPLIAGNGHKNSLRKVSLISRITKFKINKTAIIPVVNYDCETV